uniref:RING-type domain-containing protein n=1 Tax=Arcella intermedia TaxID=1963864 RepID=A0A6B2LL05_9EUKA|eukprot:TRINITY_DN9228_c0_g1_i1.p1 TRINITY_DN9228_c0_g1~~TRINITY_DN9228_c0_g1_i1.p1  ORF type:complete len:194 (+),score=36.71 TRINITY_DN9228_c0_g1_i1:47-583(+)
MTEDTECGICYDTVKERGIMNVCEHLFCYRCISKWAQRSNTCPLCNRRFTRLKRKQVVSGSENKRRRCREQVEKVPHREQRSTLLLRRLEEPEEENEDETPNNHTHLRPRSNTNRDPIQVQYVPLYQLTQRHFIDLTDADDEEEELNTQPTQRPVPHVINIDDEEDSDIQIIRPTLIL